MIFPNRSAIDSSSNQRAAQNHAADRRFARHRPCDGEEVLIRRMARHHLFAPRLSRGMSLDGGAAGPPADRPRRSPADTRRAIAEVRERLEDGRLDALVNNAAISPKGEGGSRLGLFETELEDWQTIFQVNFFAPMMLARGLIAELEKSARLDRQRHLDRRRARASLRGRGLCHFESRAGGADARNGVRPRPARRARQRNFAGRDRHRDPVAGHGEDRRANSDAPARLAAKRSPRRFIFSAREQSSYVHGAEIASSTAASTSDMAGGCPERSPLSRRGRSLRCRSPSSGAARRSSRGARGRRSSGSIPCPAASLKSARRCTRRPCANSPKRSASRRRSSLSTITSRQSRATATRVRSHYVIASFVARWTSGRSAYERGGRRRALGRSGRSRELADDAGIAGRARPGGAADGGASVRPPRAS